MKTNYMTVASLRNACKKNEYILTRFPEGKQMGVNTKIVRLIDKQNRHFNENDLTEFVSFKECSFHEYISFKHPFIPMSRG
jgi:hypothetical protein